MFQAEQTLESEKYSLLASQAPSVLVGISSAGAKTCFVCVCARVCVLAVLGLCCCARASSSCCERGLRYVAVGRLLIAVASLVAEHGL